MKSRILKLIAGLSLICGMVYASGEITLQGYLSAVKGTRSIIRSPGSLALDWTGTKYYGPVIYSATPTYQPIAGGGIVSNGIAWVRNVGTNGSVLLSFNNGTTDHLLIQIGEFFCFRINPTFTITNLSYKAASAITNDLEITLLEK